MIPEYVDKKDVLDAVNALGGPSRPKVYQDAIRDCSKQIYFLKSSGAKPAPVGSWKDRVIERSYPGYYTKVMYGRCSVCNTSRKERTKFCPNCGAAMENAERK